jgi:hypothetical protein
MPTTAKTTTSVPLFRIIILSLPLLCFSSLALIPAVFDYGHKNYFFLFRGQSKGEKPDLHGLVLVFIQRWKAKGK